MSACSITRGNFIDTGRLALPIPFGHHLLKMTCIHSITYRYFIGIEGLEPTRNLIQKILNLPRINHFRHMPFTALPRFEQGTGDLESPRLTNYHIELYKKLRSPTCGNLINFHTIKQSNYLVPTRLRRNNQLRSRLLSRRSVKLSIFIFNLYIIYKKFFVVFVFTL